MLGSLSYSLYLVHTPVGGRVINLFGRFAPDTPWADLLLSLSGLAVSLATAFIFWRWIEQPAIKLARQVGTRLEEANAVRRNS
jgi:peptidoglycan/LPS O-acetylase OafA/YrhL